MSKIYAYGMVSKSTLIRLESAYPSENGYAEIAHSHLMVSGETGNSAQVLAHWGHQVKVDGPWLGENSADFVRQYLTERQVDCSRLHIESNFRVSKKWFSRHPYRERYSEVISGCYSQSGNGISPKKPM